MDSLYKDALRIAVQPNRVFVEPDAPPTRRGLLPFIAEIPEGSAEKYEMRTATGSMILDRVICPKILPDGSKVGAMPVSYGFTPGRFNIDGDPVDVVVFGSGARYRDDAALRAPVPRWVRYVGIMKMEECAQPPCSKGQWEQDWKVIAVDQEDEEFANLRSAGDLSANHKALLTGYFANYKGASKGHSYTRVTGLGDRAEAEQFIKKFSVPPVGARSKEIATCRDLYSQLLATREAIMSKQRPQANPRFVSCLHRVFDPRFFHDPEATKLLIHYGAYQLLLDLNVKGSTLAAALARMEELRSKTKTHYRFVSYDQLGPKADKSRAYAGSGTGNAVFEWVLTKDRSKGCGAKFPPQHYEGNPTVDLPGFGG